MKASRTGLILGASLTLAGCGGGMQPPSGPVEYQQIQEECTARLDGDNVLNPLRGKVALPTAGDMTPDMLIDPDVPTPSELVAARILAADREECGQKILSWTTHFAPAQLANSQAEKARADLVMAKFLSGNLTYGNANRLWYQAYLESRNGFTEATQRQIADAQASEVKNAARNPNASKCVWDNAALKCGSR
jgi:hypothetical protein